MMFLLETTIRVSVLLVLALAAATVVGRRAAATRHWLLAAAIACAATMPLLQIALPAWRVGPLPVASGARTRAAATTTFTVQPAATAAVVPRNPLDAGAHRSRSPDASAILVIVWASGAALALSMLGVGLARLSRFAAAARAVEDRRRAIAGDIAGEIGLRRPVTLLLSDHPSLLVTWGHSRATVVLPSTSDTWPDERLRIVLRHEFAHIRRGDWSVQMLAEVLRAVHWFNPLVWLACRYLRDASEQACDDAVVSGGVRPEDYATHLLDLARAFSDTRRPAGAALAMARPSTLEGRITAMLDSRQNRRPPSARARVAISAVLLALAVPLAIAAQDRASTLSGTIVDPGNRVLRDVTVTLSGTSANAKREAKTDASGRYEFTGLADGEYELKAAQPGFMLAVQRVTIAGGDVTRDLQMQLGDVHETVTVKIGVITPGKSPTADEVSRARRERQEQAANCPAGVQAGGNILPPWKVKDVKPVYPDQLKPSNESGVVTLTATIGTDGLVRDLKTVKSPNQEFTHAATDAVRQWEFTPTYLNCAPVEVKMLVTVNFVTAERN